MKRSYTFLSLGLLVALSAFAHDLVNIAQAIPESVIEMRYATPRNITGQSMRKSRGCYLCSEPAKALKRVAEDLRQEGFTLKIWEAYQPLAELETVWRLIPNEEFVSNPVLGDAHTRGYGVDVTLMMRGKNLPMGTDYDSITLKARSGWQELPKDILRYRAYLAQVMEKHGFQADEASWWHFEFKGWETKPNLNVPFEELDAH